MIKVYIASNFSSRYRLRPYKQALTVLGYQVSSTWIDHEEPTASLGATLEFNQVEANRDTAEIRASDVVILDTLDKSRRGGREVELGMAKAWNKIIWLVGPRRNVFHFTHVQFESWDQLFWELNESKDK